MQTTRLAVTDINGYIALCIRWMAHIVQLRFRLIRFLLLWLCRFFIVPVGWYSGFFVTLHRKKYL